MSLDPTRLTPTITKDMVIMLTLTPRYQFEEQMVKTRLHKFSDLWQSIKNLHYQVTTKDQPLVGSFLFQTSTIELSEPMSSEGNKHFPRLHFHIVGQIIRPIKFMLDLTRITTQNKIGYHFTVIDSKKKFDYYKKYCKKTWSMWKASPYILPISINIDWPEPGKKERKRRNVLSPPKMREDGKSRE